MILNATPLGRTRAKWLRLACAVPLLFAAARGLAADAPGLAQPFGGSGFLVNLQEPKPISSSVKTVATGVSHAAFVKTDGSLWTMGFNEHGRLGDGTTVTRTKPVKVASGVARVSAGMEHTMFVKTDGTLWGMGANHAGQLGDGTTTSRSTPVQIATEVVEVTAGMSHTLFIKSDKTLWGVGGNLVGQLGDGTKVNRLSPVKIADEVAAVATGPNANFTYFVKTDGTLWATGENFVGQLGDGTRDNRSTPIQVATDVASVSSGMRHGLFVKSDGTLWAVGGNETGQLGDGTYAVRASPVQVATGVARAAAGAQQSLFIKTDGTLWGMGSDVDGSLAEPNFNGIRNSPAKITTSVAQVATSQFTLYVTTKGVMYGSGLNYYGQLGDAQEAPSLATLASDVVHAGAAAEHTNLLVKSDGTLWRQKSAVVTQVPGISGVTHAWVASNAGIHLFLKADGTLWRLAANDTATQVASDVVMAGAGIGYYAFLKSDGTLWGRGKTTGKIEFGAGNADVKIAEQVASVSAAAYHLLYVRDDNTLWGMGSTDAGLLPGATVANAVAAPVQLETGVKAAIANTGQQLIQKTSNELWTRGDGWHASTGPAAIVDASPAAFASTGEGTLYLSSSGVLRYREGVSGTLGTAREIAGGVISVAGSAHGWAIYVQNPGYGTAPKITKQPVAAIVTPGKAHTITATVSGTHPISYQWYKDGQPLAWARNATLVLPHAIGAQSGSYKLEAVNSAGAVTSSSVKITVNAAPTISAIADQSISEDKSTDAVPFTIGDAETSTSKLKVTAKSSDTSVVPAAGVVLGGSGSKRTVKITPAKNKHGSVTITLTVSDGVSTATRSFKVTVKSVNDTPTISTIKTQSASEDTTKKVSFTIGDAETSTTKLKVTVKSSNTKLVPSSGLKLSGTGSKRTLSITPAKNQSGTATITVTVSDGKKSKVLSFKVTFAAVNDTPTISTIKTQSASEATTKKVSFTIGDAETSTKKLKVTVKSSNTKLVPSSGLKLSGTGSKRTLSITPAKNQSGTATITVTVSDGKKSKVLSFKVTFKAVDDTPTISKIANQSISRNGSTKTLKFKVGDAETSTKKLTVTRKSSNTTLVSTSGIKLGGSGANRTVKVTPRTNRTGTATITLTVSDGKKSKSTSFKVTVKAPASGNAVAPAGPIITHQVEDRFVKAGDDVTLEVRTSDSSAIVQWFRDDAPIPGATSTKLKLPKVKLTDAGGYDATLVGSGGTTTSRTAELAIVDLSSSVRFGSSGKTVTVAQKLAVAGDASDLALELLLPSGWSYKEGTKAADGTYPDTGDKKLLVWTWKEAPKQPLTLTYTLRFPAGSTLPKKLEGVLRTKQPGGENKLLVEIPLK